MTIPIDLDKHTLALISIIGSSLDVLGALYLAYDLLGGEHGPLRTLTRAVTYGVLFGTGYGLALGPVFGLASGVAHGITLAWEYSRASRHASEAGILAGYGHERDSRLRFCVGRFLFIRRPLRHHFWRVEHGRTSDRLSHWHPPDVDYKPATRPRVTRFQLLAALNRTVGYTVTGYVSSLVAQQPEHAIAVGLKTGLAIGVVTAIIGPCTPFIEWTADHLPERRMGVFGVGLILIGFTLQSVQYWAALLDVTVR